MRPAAFIGLLTLLLIGLRATDMIGVSWWLIALTGVVYLFLTAIEEG